MGSGEAEGRRVDDNRADLAEDEEDADAVLASLEEEDDSSYRAQRLHELSVSAARSKPLATTTFDALKKTYLTLNSDDEALSFTTENERAVLHFYHPDFLRCNTMDHHCQQIAEKHAENAEADVSFARIDVKNAPFVVQKLGVKVLPCVIGFVKGVVKGRVTGFEGLCWDGKEDSINVTRALEQTFVDWTILRKRLFVGHDNDGTDEENDNDGHGNRQSVRRGIRGRQQQADDDDDWD